MRGLTPPASFHVHLLERRTNRWTADLNLHIFEDWQLRLPKLGPCLFDLCCRTTLTRPKSFFINASVRLREMTQSTVVCDAGLSSNPNEAVFFFLKNYSSCSVSCGERHRTNFFVRSLTHLLSRCPNYAISRAASLKCLRTCRIIWLVTVTAS